MPKIKIDNIEVEVENGITIMQACENLGIEIPRFCYHDRLSIAGNCRMCLVEMENSNKPVASCAMPVSEGMNISTKSELVKKARNGVMEFLLINHPLDCPICDQGGECDLQDQAMAYGSGISRFVESKRAVKDKNLGPLIKTHMTRCIHCTRCVRFAEEVAGVEQLGTTGRGEDTEITTYLEKTIDSELSGNIIDLCPVGALTSKPYAFISRPWELKKIDSIDVMDAVGSNIRFDVKGDKIMRVLPRINESINEEWISDKARFAYDGLLNQRLDTCYIRKDNKLVEVSNIDLIEALSKNISSSKKIAGILGNVVDCETAFAFKCFLTELGSKTYDCRQDNAFFISNDRSSYLFNSSISGIDECDLILLIGCDVKKEAPIINARIRKKYLIEDRKFKIGFIGPESALNYDHIKLGDSPEILEDLIAGKSNFCKYLKYSKKPLFIIGQGALCRNDSEAIFLAAKKLYENQNFDKKWNGFNVLQNHAGRTGGLDIDFVSSDNLLTNKSIISRANDGEFDLLYLFAADEVDLGSIPEKTTIVYHGHHGDYSANKADIIIPAPCFTETEGIFVNTEGRPQISAQVKEPLPNVNEAWKFFLKFAEYNKISLGFKSFEELRSLMFNKFPHLSRLDIIKPNNFIKSKKKLKKIKNLSIKPSIENFYMTNIVSRMSKVMADCSKNKK